MFTIDVSVSHYNDIIMTTIASQITSLAVVYSTVYSDADQRKHQSSASLAFVWGIHRDRWIPRTKVQLRGKCFHLMTSSWYAVTAWWRHDIVTFPALLAFVSGVHRWSPLKKCQCHKGPVVRSFDTFINANLNTQSRGRWLSMSWRSFDVTLIDNTYSNSLRHHGDTRWCRQSSRWNCTSRHFRSPMHFRCHRLVMKGMARVYAITCCLHPRLSKPPLSPCTTYILGI